MIGDPRHLSYDLAPDSRIRASLDLDERENGVLVEEQMVERPACSCAVSVGNPELPLHLRPSARSLGVDLVAGEERRLALQQ